MPWQKHQNLRKLLLKLHRQFFLPHEKAATLMAQLKTQMGTSVVFSNVFYVGIGNIHYNQNCSFDEWGEIWGKKYVKKLEVSENKKKRYNEGKVKKKFLHI